MSSVCVECGNSVPSLYTSYTTLTNPITAPTKSDNICLSKCPHCLHFCDSYIEHDSVLVFIDMLLHKPAVYRHLIINRYMMTYTEGGVVKCNSKEDALSGGWWFYRLVLLRIVFEVYVKLRSSAFLESEAVNIYIKLFIQSSVEYLVLWLSIRALISLTLRYQGNQTAASRLNLLPFLLITSSFPSLLHIPMLIWDYRSASRLDVFNYEYLIRIAVLTSMAEALSAVYAVEYVWAYMWVGVGIAGKGLAGSTIHALLE